MSPITVVIVDDEEPARNKLKSLIDNFCPDLRVIALAESAVDGKNAVRDLQPDAVFLDINMPVLDGFDFLDSIPNRNFMVVFVTAGQEYAVRAVKANAIDYLVKPFSIKELQQCANRLVTRKRADLHDHSEISKKVLIPKGMGFEFLESACIVRLEADDCYTNIYPIGNKKITVSRTLKQFESVLPEETFIRTHKSHIINLKFMKAYSKLDGGYVLMTDGSKVEVSRRKTTEFLTRVKKYFSA
jgi:two-component system, LytTR family, response regulator